MNDKILEKKYDNYISLGYFCEVAKDLEKLGLRSHSSPFDWIISSFQGELKAIDSHFDDFLQYENLSQNTSNRSRYREDQYQFVFYHDFDKYESLDRQYASVKAKYDRRIHRFMESIQNPTLFIRYIPSEPTTTDHSFHELKWIETHTEYINQVIKKYNPQNEIIFLGDESLHSDIIKIYHVPKDEGDTVSRLPIYNNAELFPVLSTVAYDKRKKNQKHYAKKQRKIKREEQSLRKKIQRKLDKLLAANTSPKNSNPEEEHTKPEYIHNKTYNNMILESKGH